ncbi:MAG: hypothetical protein CVU90_15150 [Firmicutes bacterium HGW-Firmicutes-15]|jgi:phage-related protein|nr:MAG: hypothetical protein CVU90_15150 [Firmicutes bacterium HGW-Firmicutes-15]
MDIVINGTSLASLGVIVENRTSFVKPKKRTEPYLIPGRDGVFFEELETFDGYPLSYKIVLTDSTKFDQIYALLNGNVILEVADDPMKIRYAKVIEGIDFNPLAIWQKSTISFYVYDPFRYVKSESNTTRTTTPTTVTNQGTYESLPLIKITGSGTVVLTINGSSFTYIFDTPYVFIDSKTQEAYYLTSNDKTLKMEGDFPKLAPGSNAISWTGTITELVITPRSRFL